MSNTLPEQTVRPREEAPETPSPRSIASLPSPPSSPRPQIGEENSTPGTPSSFASDLPMSSLSSSLLLSGASSPGPHALPQEDAASRTLIIPSLTIPQYDPARGDAVGNIKLWVIGAGLPDCQTAAESIVKDAPLVSQVDEWIFTGNGVARLRASTVSTAHQSFLSKWNVQVFVADVSIDSVAQPASMVDSILAAIQEPFTSTDRLLNESEPSTTCFLPLLTSLTTSLHTAVVYLRSSPCTRHDQVIINELSPYIPVIAVTMPSLFFNAASPKVPPTPESAATSTVRPNSLVQLRDSLFLSPSTLHHLRTEAAERFLRWRDLNAALRSPESPTVHPLDVFGSRELSHNPRTSASGTRSIRGASHSQTMPKPLLQGRGRSEEHARGWMWDWESRFSRDVLDQQQRHPLPTTSQPPLSGASTNRIPLSVVTSNSAIAEFSHPTNAIRNGGRLPSPPIPHDPSPVRRGEEDSQDKSDGQEADDPLHLRSVARIAVSLVPALLRRYRILRPRPTIREHLHKREGDEGIMSWGMFGFGVSVGVMLSMCIVGIGVELSNHVWSKG